MLERNSSETFAKSGKLHPERWYDMDRSLRLNIVLTYEARVYDAVLQGGPDHKHSCHTTEPKMAVYFKISTISPDLASLIPRATCGICARLDKRIGCFVADPHALVPDTDLHAQDGDSFHGVHVINIETKDNHDEAVVSGKLTCELCKKLETLTDIETEIVAALDEFQAATNRPLVYTLVYI